MRKSGVQQQSVDQKKWNNFGIIRRKQIEENPDKYILSNWPVSDFENRNELMRVLTPIQDKRILELGCGRGDFSVWLAKQGARVTAVDIGPDLVTAARTLARVNQVDSEFRQANIVDLPFDSATFDVVIGLAILHHLSQADVLKAVRECYRVLKPGGTAVFQEPVENSKLFDFLQNLFPAGKKTSGYYRPSILQRKAWTAYVEALEDRSMTNREIISAGEGLFRVVNMSPYGLMVRLTRLFGNNHRNTLLRLDRFLFKVFPPLRYYSQMVHVEYQK